MWIVSCSSGKNSTYYSEAGLQCTNRPHDKKEIRYFQKNLLYLHLIHQLFWLIVQY